ncbi:MAG: GNAT family N-acetyltransferase [Alcanivoracaceae bacterium]|nr:GNAT family N-acetyltransferase [Alcanivoracaceae bacterium]
MLTKALKQILTPILITPFSKQYEQQVIDLIVGIQSGEFAVEINADDQPDLKNIKQYYQWGNGNFWIALDGEEVLGTISLCDIGNKQVALRKMFVKQGFRGQPLNIGQNLLDTALNWSKDKLLEQVFLGTVANYHAAHKFYEKNNFIKIDQSKLPTAFNVMEVDKLFYYFNLTPI